MNFEGGFARGRATHWIGSGEAETRRILVLLEKTMEVFWVENGYCDEHDADTGHCEMNRSKSAGRLMNGDEAWPRNRTHFPILLST